MAHFNANKPYRIVKTTTVGVVAYEIHQSQTVLSPGGPIQVFEPITTTPSGNTKHTFTTLVTAKDHVYNKKIENDGSEIVWDSEVDG